MDNNIGYQRLSQNRTVYGTLESLASLIKYKESLEELHDHDSSITMDILRAVVNDACAWVSIFCYLKHLAYYYYCCYFLYVGEICDH